MTQRHGDSTTANLPCSFPLYNSLLLSVPPTQWRLALSQPLLMARSSDTLQTLLQGFYSSAVDASPATRRLGNVFSAAASSFGFVFEALSFYLRRHKAAPAALAPQLSLTEHRSWPSWSYACGDGSDDGAASDTGDDDDREALDGADDDDGDGSSSCSVADTLYSLPDVVTQQDFDIEPCWLVRQHTPPAALSAQHKAPQLPPSFMQHLAQRAAHADGGYVLPRQLFIPATPLPGSLRRRRQLRSPRGCRTSESSLTGLELQTSCLPRSSGSWFVPATDQGELLCLPAPVFRPDSLVVGLFCEQGQRTRNEDSAFSTRIEPPANGACSFQKSICFGVFDGHGGHEVAVHLTECLPRLVCQRCQRIEEHGVGEIATIMLGVESELQQRFSSEWQPEERDPGSTALVATIMDETLFVANVGDCRLLLISEAVDHLGNRTAYVSNATTDHHCGRNPSEAARVRKAGATIDESGYIGSLLEVSRSIGDFQTKSELGSGVIISEPEVYTWKLGPRDLLLVAVSDGISSVMDDMAICNMVCTQLNERRRLNDPAHAAKELASYASLTSTDNCSAVVVVLKDAPPPAPARRRLFGRKA